MIKKLILPIIALSNFLVINSCMAIISLPEQKNIQTGTSSEKAEIVNTENNQTITTKDFDISLASNINNPENLEASTTQTTSNYSNKIEKLIFEKTNQERVKQNLPPLKQEKGLDKLAQMHSKNMLENSFFSHTDKSGLSSSGRKEKYYPQLFGSIGENIFFIEGYSGDENIANKIIDGWMNSQGHRENILRKEYTHLGVGIAFVGNKVYATQNFSDAEALLISSIPEKVKYGESLNLKFDFLGSFDKNKLSIFLEFPDKTQKFFTSDGSYYVGSGRYNPVWSGNSFTVNIKFDKGKGNYILRTGRDNSFYESGLKINVQ